MVNLPTTKLNSGILIANYIAGETLLSYTIGFGHYLPPNDNMLKAFTAYDIEE